MKTILFIIALTLSCFASAQDLQSIKLDYLLQQQQAAVAMQSRQIEVLQNQIKHLRQQQVPPQQVQDQDRSQEEDEYDPNASAEPQYSPGKNLLAPATVAPTRYEPPAQYQHPLQNVAYTPYGQPVVYQQPRFKYVPIPTASLPIRYIRVQY